MFLDFALNVLRRVDRRRGNEEKGIITIIIKQLTPAELYHETNNETH